MPMTPESIAHYRISSKLGEGAMGEVYRATDSKLGREVAIKLIPEDFARDALRMARFTREAQVLASLNHPNIAAIYGVEDRALIMELVEGQTLSERIKQGAIPLDEALEITRQIADGLEAAHDKGIVHRDLKPANIKITPNGTVKLLDFGLAKAEGPWSSNASVEDAPTLTVASTGAGVILGTAAYMAPEQARGRNVDKRADIWAFGVIVYEMLTGEQMFEGETVTDVLAAVVRQDPDLKRVPEKVRPLLQRCLEKDPKRRLRDAGDAMLLLDTAPVTAVAAKASKTPLLVLGGVAVLLGVVLAGLAFVHFRESPTPAEVVRFQMALPDNVNFTQFGVSTISPDGRKVAFSAYGYDGTPRVWIRTLDSPTAKPLMETRIAQQQFPFIWSPDSRYVLFDSERKLTKIDINGGAPEVLSDLQPLGGSWSDAGTILFGAAGGIFKLPASGGKPAVVVKAEPKQVHAYPLFLPDGRHFLYMRGAPEGKRGIYLGDLEATSEAQSATPLASTDFGFSIAQANSDAQPTVLYLRDTTLVAQTFDMSALTLAGEPVTVAEQVSGIRNAAIGHLSASKTGTLVYRMATGNNRQLTWYNRQGDVVGRPGDRAPYGTMKVAPDGSRAVVVQTDPRQPDNTDLWIVDLTTGASTRFTFDAAADAQPVWSPDGRSIAWMSNRAGDYGLYRKAADGSGTDELVAAPKGFSNLTDWTHNGYFIFAIQGDIYALPVDADASGTRTPIPVIQSPSGQRGAYVSPDNRWIAYLSNETGRDEIYVQPFSAGGSKASGKWMVSRGTRGMARWRGDSKELMFINGEGSVVSVDVTAGAAFQTSQPKKLFQMPLELLSNQNPGTLADATRDAQRLLLVMPVQENSQRELAVVLNWPSGVKR
jgi:tRNA A-37 threonylcarbamoyl transferase component Bud32/dipeptidyl aminopeptidase/acylaminoacyl peptidase